MKINTFKEKKRSIFVVPQSISYHLSAKSSHSAKMLKVKHKKDPIIYRVGPFVTLKLPSLEHFPLHAIFSKLPTYLTMAIMHGVRVQHQ